MSYTKELEGMTFKELILRRLADLDMTQLEFARRIEVNKSSVNRWCNDEERLFDSSKRPDLIPRIALALRIPMTLVCDAMDRSGMFQPRDAASSPEAVWIEHDVLPEMEYWAGIVIDNHIFDGKSHERLVVDGLYDAWLRRNAVNDRVIVRFPVRDSVALQWYETERLDTWASLSKFLSKAIMDAPPVASVRPDPYVFAGKECDAALDVLRDYENTRYAIREILAQHPETADGNGYIADNTRFFELYGHVHTQWALEYDANGEAHVPLDARLHGADHLTCAIVRAQWIEITGRSPAQHILDDIVSMMDIDGSYKSSLRQSRCTIAWNQ